MSTSAATYSTRVRSSAEKRASREAAAWRNLHQIVDEGWNYFWSRRSVPPPPMHNNGYHSFKSAQNCK